MAKRQTAVTTTCEEKLSPASVKAITAALEASVKAQIAAVKATLTDGCTEMSCSFWRAASAALDGFVIFVRDNNPKPGEEHTKLVASLQKAIDEAEKTLDKLLKEADS